MFIVFFFFKQKSAYEMRISDWSSDVCSSDLSIADIAARLVIEKPDMLAFIESDRSLYLGNLVTKARKIAAVLATRGLVPGDVVSFQLPNWLETAVINLACCIGGFVCNPIIPIYREAEVGYILRDGRAKILFVPTSFRGFDYVNMARALQAGLPDLATIVTVRGEAEGCIGYAEPLAYNATYEIGTAT